MSEMMQFIVAFTGKIMPRDALVKVQLDFIRTYCSDFHIPHAKKRFLIHHNVLYFKLSSHLNKYWVGSETKRNLSCSFSNSTIAIMKKVNLKSD